MTVLTGVAKFLGFSVDDLAIRRAVERSSKGEMTKLYKSTGELIQRDIGKSNAGFLMPNEKTENSEIAEADLIRLIERYAPTMRRLGYPAEDVDAVKKIQL